MKIEFAPPPKDAHLLPDFVEEFSRKILGIEWDEILFVSDESSVLDFVDGSVAETVDLIQQAYGVHCGDIDDLNLWQVMHRCSDRVTGES